ncbi:hypothetical protein J2X32_000565 [Rheinheimera pacifica]|uniref:hypothetical protein n=1 Tax=Rheinheimera pacifica TaxID=173990 RepID=UPI0028574411|nr:hypothetical protein [Rheinheimera pacifica]MDR6981957.1 hypothetical protein [Rheinheimera pacifica]
MARMNKIRYIYLACLSASGCTAISNNWLPDDLINTSSLENSYISEQGKIDLNKINLMSMNGTSSSAMQLRDEFISRVVTLSDNKCSQHKAKIIANTSIWNVGTGTASILFAGAASVLSHAQTAAELSAAAAATTGIQSLVNKEVYAQALGTTIVRAIDVAREKKMANIQRGIGKSDYSAYRALIDLTEYHNACSLMVGITEVTKALDNRKASQNEIQLSRDQLIKSLDSLNQMSLSDTGMTQNELNDQKKILIKAIQDKTLQLAQAKND